MMRVAEAESHAALRKHRLPPPDAGYARRLREFADACDGQQIAFESAAREGLMWKPLAPVNMSSPTS
jgi:hypothetical protein